MIFRLAGKEVRGRSAIEIVRALERDDNEYRYCGGSICQYLSWSLNQLGEMCHPRELGLSDRLDDETLALGYLFLLDECGVGEIVGELEE